ncbi:hypothetical protein RFI_25440 [Reticulomyxa filosa]|uniref:Uncharacterized protein n=1 Tax=Reticulomyxa filosa TaxID=46433 RepID=X6MEW0_RETFI|nr:hypothetical protein RFI_25440 [Reticulomyxa filosa]|eukprot:ETO11937.1 hypothetical protein RFI_25440 [Reticulomyxa filosa]
MICLGLLLGSDYAEGVKGVGYKRVVQLMERAVKQYGNPLFNEDKWLEHMRYWVGMSEQEMDALIGTYSLDTFGKANASSKTNKKTLVQKLVENVRLTYHSDPQAFSDIIDAYLNPLFSPNDAAKLKPGSSSLFEKKWLNWKLPDLIKLREFGSKYLQIDAKAIDKHGLDMMFDMYAHQFISDKQLRIMHIVKERTKNKVPMYEVEWKCNSTEIQSTFYYYYYTYGCIPKCFLFFFFFFFST